MDSSERIRIEGLSEARLREIGKALGDKFRSKNVEPILAAQGVQPFRDELDELLRSASQPGLTSAHRIAACNALCGFADQCVSSEHVQLKDLVCNEATSSAMLDVYLVRFESAKAKSMKQVLDSFLRNIAHQQQVSKQKTIERSLQTIWSTVYAGDNHVRAKPCFHALTALLNKQLVSPNTLLENFELAIKSKISGSGDPGEPLNLDHLLPKLLTAVFEWVPKADIAPVVGQFLSAYLKRMTGDDAGSLFHRKIWSRCLAGAMVKHFDNAQAFTLQLFPVIFKADSAMYWDFLTYLRIVEFFESPSNLQRLGSSVEEQTQQAVILCSALQVGKSLGLVEMTDAETGPLVTKTESSVQLRDKAIGRLIQDSELSIRIAGVSLLVTSFQTSRPFTRRSLEILRSSLPFCFAEADANFRGEALSLIQHLVDRIKASTAYLKRNIDQMNKKGLANDAKLLTQTWQRHKEFLTWFHDLITHELHPCASYQRHVTAIKSLHILIKSGVDTSVSEEHLSKNAKGEVPWTFELPIMNIDLERMLTDCLMDPYEDIRHFAATAMKVCRLESEKSAAKKSGMPSDVLAFESASQVASNTMLRTGRMDHADGFARAFDLVFHFALTSEVSTAGQDQPTSISPNPAFAHVIIQNIASVERSIAIAKQSLASAVDGHPIHGQLTSLRYVLEGLVQSPAAVHAFLEIENRFLEDLCRIQHDIWDCVRDLLCNDAPEGFVPEDLEDDAGLTTKDILSYAWRALKESSLLLRAVIMSVSSLAPQDGNRQLTHIKFLGDLCFTQLAELRHRGAFSTVAQSFAVTCVECTKSPNAEVRALTDIWYRKTLDIILAQGAKITRRSAGIPPMIVGLLVAGHDFRRTIDDLKSIAVFEPSTVADGSDLPQVHALNCLKAIFVSTKLVVPSEPFLVDVVSLAAKSLASSLWPIRNCGLMLFRGLIDRLLGSHESFDEAFAATTGSRLAYDRFPGLLDLLFELLSRYADNRDNAEQAAAESVFPVLDLFRRAPPPESRKLKVQALVLKAMASTQWHIREIAARSYASVAGTEFDLEVQKLLDFSDMTENVVHGRLLAIKHYLEVYKRSLFIEHDVQLITSSLTTLAQDLSESSFSPAVLATVLDVTHILLIAALKQDTKSTSLVAQLDRANKACTQVLTKGYSVLPGLPRMQASLSLSQTLQATLSGATDESKASSMAVIFQDIHVEGLEWILARLKELKGTAKEGVIRVWTRALEQELLSDPTPRRRSTAQSTWVDLTEELRSRNAGREMLDNEALARLNLAPDTWKTNTPFTTQSLLKLWGYVLDAKFAGTGSWSAELVGEATIWVNFVKASLAEENEFPLRFAAAKSLCGLSGSWSSPAAMPANLEIAILSAIYTALVDDDDEVRGVAAAQASLIVQMSMPVQERGRSWTAPVAARKICGLLVHRHKQSTTVLKEAIARLTGASQLPAIGDARKALQDATHEDTSLFAVEKQNLYVDDVRETEAWSAVLKQLQNGALERDHVAALTLFAVEGLEALQNYAQEHKDGALGWTSKSETFAFGFRVLRAASVILAWRRTLGAGSAETSASIRSLLVTLSSAGVHPLWRKQIMKTLEQDVAKGVFRVSGLLNTILA